MPPVRKWYEKTERSEAKALAKEKGRFVWQYTRKVKARGKFQADHVDHGFYVGMFLPKALTGEKVKSSVVFEPKGEPSRKHSKESKRR